MQMPGLGNIKVYGTEMYQELLYVSEWDHVCPPKQCLNNFLEWIEQHWQYLLHVAYFLSLSFSHASSPQEEKQNRQDKNAFGKVHCSVLNAFILFIIEKVRSCFWNSILLDLRRPQFLWQSKVKGRLPPFPQKDPSPVW